MSDGEKRLLVDRTGGLMGRHVWHDPRNRGYSIQAELAAGTEDLKTRTWWRRGYFDQGSSSSCTSHAAGGLIRTSPFRLAAPEKPHLREYDDEVELVALYEESKRYDPWPGENYDGTSSDAPFKVLRERGVIGEWRWCFGINDVLRTLSHFGPVAIGVSWLERMMETDERGFIRSSGAEVGGHEVELVGINVPGSYVTGVNSWGRWGYHDSGRFRLSFSDLEERLEDSGDAVTVVMAAEN